jgi:ABC-type lipoprotein release transport system permease subunit
VVGNTNFRLTAATRTRLATDPQISARTFALDGTASVNGRSTEFLAFDPKGTAPPVAVAGRLPRAGDEVALGRQFMRGLGVGIGSTVQLSLQDQDFGAAGDQKPRRMLVVGEALVPPFGDDADIGQGGLVTLAGVRASGGRAGVQLALTRLRDGPTDTALRRLDRTYTQELTIDLIPARVVNLHRVRGVPLIGVALAGFLAIFVLVYALVASVRARTHELAVLRALGLRPRRLRRVLGWQGGLLAAGMVVIGMPIGLLLGAGGWLRVADGLGIGSDITVSPWLLAVAPLVLAVAIISSVVPARRARRESVATLLRVE